MKTRVDQTSTVVFLVVKLGSQKASSFYNFRASNSSENVTLHMIAVIVQNRTSHSHLGRNLPYSIPRSTF